MSTLYFEFPDPPFTDSRREAGDLTNVDWTTEWDSVLGTLTNYVQPDSALSLDDAVKQVARFWNDIRPGCSNAVLAVPIAIAEHIPYDHASNKKLADFMLALHDSGKWITGSKLDDLASEQERFWTSFCDYLWKNDWRPHPNLSEGEQPIRYANFCAFVANLTFPEQQRHRFDYMLAKAALSDAAESNLETNLEIRDARTIGAAQYVILHAGTMFDEVMKIRKREAEVAEANRWSRRILHGKKQLERQPEEEFDWREWQEWRQMFREATIDETKSQACREAAPRAADSMALQEKIANERSAQV